MNSTWEIKKYTIEMLSRNINRYCLVSKSCLTLSQPRGLKPTRLLCPWDFPSKTIEVDCHFLIQGSSQLRD